MMIDRHVRAQIHAYGAITPFGASSLHFATGTTGLKLGYRQEPKKKVKKAKGGATVETEGDDEHVEGDRDDEGPLPDLPPEAYARGVGSREYRDILAGTGPHATQIGLLTEVRDLFQKAGRSPWIWQQDGARAHTVKDTALGRPTRKLILEHADQLLEGWPSCSPDLSPIENVWMLVEHRLWTTYTWHDLRSMKDALRKAWADVTGDVNLMARMCTSFEKRRLACIEAEGDQVSW